MAVAPQVHANGVKSLTTGTTFTITLTTTANDAVLVAVAIPSTTTVQSIADTNGNVYRRITSVANGTSVTTELWTTSNVQPLATGGTITVTLSATGVTAAGAAASYRGVVISGAHPQTSTGAASPITSGSQTLQQATSYLVMAGGMAAANAFTATNGVIRDQITTTGVSVCLMDSNGGASPVTDSATMTAAAWGVAFAELQPVAIISEDDYSRFSADWSVRFFDDTVVEKTLGAGKQRVSQNANLTLGENSPKTRVSQNANLTLGENSPKTRVSQVATLVLIDVLVDSVVSPTQDEEYLNYPFPGNEKRVLEGLIENGDGVTVPRPNVPDDVLPNYMVPGVMLTVESALQDTGFVAKKRKKPIIFVVT